MAAIGLSHFNSQCSDYSTPPRPAQPRTHPPGVRRTAPWRVVPEIGGATPRSTPSVCNRSCGGAWHPLCSPAALFAREGRSQPTVRMASCDEEAAQFDSTADHTIFVTSSSSCQGSSSDEEYRGKEDDIDIFVDSSSSDIFVDFSSSKEEYKKS